MSNYNTKIIDLEDKLLTLQKEVEQLRVKNVDLEERLKAYALVNVGQVSLINKLIDKVPFGVMLLDEKKIIIHANAVAGIIFSSPPLEMAGQHYSNYFELPDNHSPAVDNKDMQLQKITCKNDDKFVMHSVFVSDEGSEKVTVETFLDVSEIRKAEQDLIRVNKTKDEFLGMISHELRSPLNVIQGYNSLLEEEVVELKNKNVSLYIKYINDAGERLLNLVNDLLEMSDLTAGKIKADYIPIDLSMIITQLQYRAEKEFHDKGNQLIFYCEEIKPFEQDLVLLMKVLYELLSNANKFTENGEVVVTISLVKKNKGDYLSFQVADTGCGMVDETINQIFNTFHQEDSSLTRSHNGLGLGLSLVDKRLQVIKGHIEVASELNKGSTFSVFVPYLISN